jgi:hypothetical protein
MSAAFGLNVRPSIAMILPRTRRMRLLPSAPLRACPAGAHARVPQRATLSLSEWLRLRLLIQFADDIGQ